MKEQFVTYEIALKLKELGFDSPCLAYFNGDGEICQTSWDILESNEKLNYVMGNKSDLILCPIWQQVFDFLHNKHIYVCISKQEYGWHTSIKRKGKMTKYDNWLEPFIEVRKQIILKAIKLKYKNCLIE